MRVLTEMLKDSMDVFAIREACHHWVARKIVDSKSLPRRMGFQPVVQTDGNFREVAGLLTIEADCNLIRLRRRKTFLSKAFMPNTQTPSFGSLQARAKLIFKGPLARLARRLRRYSKSPLRVSAVDIT